jgi:ATP-dependent DNA helicase RecG
MNPTLDRLTKILRLEAQQGYKNNAVIGGLEKMLPFWEPEARRTLEPELAERLVAFIHNYAGLNTPARASAVGELLGQVGGAVEAAPRRPPPGEPRPVPPRPEPGAAPAHTRYEDHAPQAPSPALAPAEEARPTPPPAERPHPAAPAPLAEAPRPRRITPAPARPAGGPVALDAPLTVLKGVGAKHAKTLENLGLHTLGDMLTFYPRRYDDFSQMKPINRLEYGDEVTIIATIWETHVRKIRGGQASVVRCIVGDGTGTIECSWFNQPWLAEKLRHGLQLAVSGRVEQYLGRLVMQSPAYEPVDRQMLHAGRIVPVYPLTQGVTARWLREKMNAVVGQWADRVPDPLPEAVRQRNDLLDYGAALRQVHFPDGQEALVQARLRLAFDELLRLQLGALRQRAEWQSAPGRPLAVADEWLAGRVSALPFALTQAQQRVLADVRADLARPIPMTRLLQGDVGSGKTVLAALAAAIAHANGAQSAIMAPTSILAEQHYRTFDRLLASEAMPGAPKIVLLQGATPDSEKAAIYEGLRQGQIDIVIGTHALIEGPVEFARLGLAVVDEQHRFGVSQRAALRAKGGENSPHLLVMSATPIPRSLALTLYGDLDLSVLDEMPPGRQPIETRILYQKERERAYFFLRSQVQKGRQAYIICPLVEESDKIEAKAAVDEYERLHRYVFPDLRLGLLHGRLKGDEKEEVMGRFQAGDLDILVSTSVVEVGVDVPNATVMLIEGANRFGLAQLHQFRGRVGRGEHASYCLLVSDQDTATIGNGDERLRALERSNDGFELAGKDLEMRGPGEFMGTRQAGFGDLRLARLTDLRLIELARKEAQTLFAEDPNLEKPEHHSLAAWLTGSARGGAGDIS